MMFATTRNAALELMAKAPVDLVVSDMHMPTMDGAELLSKVPSHYPKTIRFVLSGFADQKAILQTIGPSHRYLAKPCDEKTLLAAIQNSLKLCLLLHGSALETRVGGLAFIPCTSKSYADIIAELGSKYSSKVFETVSEVWPND